MRGGLGPRFLIEAGFLIAVAFGIAFAGLDAIWIIVVMAGAWLLVATIEWGISRVRRPAAAPVAAPAELPTVQAFAPLPETTAVVAAPPPLEEPAAGRSEPVPEPAPKPEVTPGPSPEPEVTPGPSPEPQPGPSPEPEPEPAGEPAPPEPVPDQPPVTIAAVPDPEPEPEAEPLPPPVVVEPAAPEPAPEEPRVVAMTPRSLGVPQRWNLWELERVAREQSGADAIRDEERSFLLMYLREFADADGVLPTSFDGVVREAFGDALDAVRA